MKILINKALLIILTFAVASPVACRDFSVAAKHIKKMQFAERQQQFINGTPFVDVEEHYNDKMNPTLMWQQLKKIPALVDKRLMPPIEAMVQSTVANARSSEQLTLVNDILELEQQAKDLRAQIMVFIKRFEQIYKFDAERARELYVIIVHDLTILKSIRKRMNEINAGFK